MTFRERCSAISKRIQSCDPQYILSAMIACDLELRALGMTVYESAKFIKYARNIRIDP